MQDAHFSSSIGMKSSATSPLAGRRPPQSFTMQPRTLLLLSLHLLLSSALVLATDSDSDSDHSDHKAECKDGLDKLYNQFGQSPCVVQANLESACRSGSDSTAQCTCNTVMYNIAAACTVCYTGSIPNWSNWADDNDCDGNPLQFPSHVVNNTQMIPNWAYQQLSNSKDFDLGAALAASGSSSSNPSNHATVAAQVAVPIAAGVGVALVAILAFWLYWRRKWRRHRNPRDKSLPLIPGADSNLWRPWRWFYGILPSSASSRRLRPSKKDSDWAIDGDEEDTKHLTHSRGPSTTSYIDPFTLVQSPLNNEPEAYELDVPHTSPHIKETSSSALLPHLDFPDVRVPTFMERFIKFKDGLRKSSTYKAKYVSPVSPDPQFRIDDSAVPTPVAKDFLRDGSNFGGGTPFRPGGEATGGRVGASASASGSGSANGRLRIQQQKTERSNHRPQPEGEGSSVLIISRDGRDFSLDDTATIPLTQSHPSSPQTTTLSRQYSEPLSAISGTGTGSGIPSPNRANTASTISGAWPTELRHNPDLTSPRSWATRFPAPPEAFPPPPPSAFRTHASPTDKPPAYEQKSPTSS
ncbi:hypothetical protein C8Q73DRAFT_487326 [Cubamyces lactineus]|nr:hypothetical protein C8Q73DRAFT_487326 [Cubamyces lactineus]